LQLVPDFRSNPSESAEGKGIAKRAWAAYSSAMVKAGSPVVDPAARMLARKWTEEAVGFWVMWHSLGGFEGLERFGMHKTTIWRKVKKFRLLTGQHPDEFVFTGITVDVEKVWDSLAADPGTDQD
jgi:hypothetical protein